jgi:DNA-binding LytR/AlgR family response regulator
MTCIIIEDQPPAQRILKKYIEDIGTLQLRATLSDALQAMAFLEKENVDVIFLDIHLPKMSGMDFLKTMVRPPHIILTTAFSDYALDGYEYNVVDYLLKPFSFARFAKAIAKIPAPYPTEQTLPTTEQRKEIFIKSGYEHIKISIDDILYIKSDADYTEIHTADKKQLSSEPLRYWQKELEPFQFFRIHKSYLINCAKIDKLVGNQVYLMNGIVVPIGRAFKDGFGEKVLK